MMRISRVVSIAMVCVFLSGCVTSLLIGNPLQSKMMWSLLKPLVGFDPNEVNLFEIPMVKDRMTSLLGDKYEPTMKMLTTAKEIQQEGALFYVASRMIPTEVKAVQDKAGLVWNSDTNQMAVLVVQNGAAQIFSEQPESGDQKIEPVLPKELQLAYDEAQALQKAM